MSHLTVLMDSSFVLLFSTDYCVMPRPSPGCVANTQLVDRRRGATEGSRRRRLLTAAGGAGEWLRGRCNMIIALAGFRRGSTHEWEAGIDPSFPSW